MILSEKLYKDFLRFQGDELVAIWLHTDWDEDRNEMSPDIATFEYRREVFFSILERLLREGKARLVEKKNEEGEQSIGEILYTDKENIEDQIEKFRIAWPENEKDSGYEDFYWWFFDKSCPYSILWNPIK